MQYEHPLITLAWAIPAALLMALVVGLPWQ